MSKNKLKIGDISKPRFEFRTFGQDFSESSKLMTDLSISVPEKVRHRQSDEIYIVSCNDNINNTKIRNEMMDVKTYFSNLRQFHLQIYNL